MEHEADMEIDVESPVGSEHGGDDDSGMEDGTNQHQHQHHHQHHLGVSREAGAETEVEEGGTGRPRRVLRNGNHSPVEDEGQADEEMVDLNALAEEEVAVAVLDDEGGDDMGVRVVMDGEDIDGTVGGKRKR